MFRNYLTIALRNIHPARLYSLINIAGLGVGLACAILITLFVRDELSYDKWIPGSRKSLAGRGHLPCARPLRSDHHRANQHANPGCHARPDPRSAQRHPPGARKHEPDIGRPAIFGTCGRCRSEFPAGHPVAAGGGRSAYGAGRTGKPGHLPERRAQIFRQCRSHRQDPDDRAGRLRSTTRLLRQHERSAQGGRRNARPAAQHPTRL